MAISFGTNGVYRFISKSGSAGRALNAYGSSSLVNGRNVNVYDYSRTDKAEQWRLRWAGKASNGYDLYWMNNELGGTAAPLALDRYTGSTLNGNADVYQSADSTVSAADQLVYFRSINAAKNIYAIQLFSSGLTLTCDSDSANGSNAPVKLAEAGNVYWATYTGNNKQQWIVEEVGAGKQPNDLVSKFGEKHFYSSANASWPYYVGECTWYCNGRAYEKTGKPAMGKISNRSAKYWLDSATVGKVVRGKVTPVANSIAVFGNSPAGHVVYVESVDSTNVYYSEANGTGKNKDGSPRTISNGQIEVLPVAEDGKKMKKSISEFKNMLSGTYLGYIDLN